MFKDKLGRILYVGKAINLRNRVRSHFGKDANIQKGEMMKAITDIDWIRTDDEKQALILENELIKKYKPRYNIQWRDDKSYFWVVFNDDKWPRVRIVHKSQATSDEPLIGPYTNGKELRSILRALRKIFPYRTCKNPYRKPCLQWHLSLCPAHGLTNSYEVKLRKNYLKSLNALARFLLLYAGEPIRVEAYDISNIHGVWATGSMIVFYGDKTSKNDYRRFKIKTVQGANDVAMIKEVLKRRFGHPEWPYPDLILIDGGIAQFHAASKFLVASNYPLIPVIALAKQQEEIYTGYSNKALKLSALPVQLRLTFQAIRNEAHRFAIFYYRHLHGKEFRTRRGSKKIRAKD